MARSSPLSRHEIAVAALAVLDADGADGFSVRRVAEELGSGTMSLYRHVEDRDDLVRAMAEEILDGPFDAVLLLEDWVDRVRAAAIAIRGLVQRHSAAMSTIMSSLPIDYVPARVLGAMRLDASDLDPAQQSLVAQTVMPFLAGWCLAEGRQPLDAPSAPLDRFEDVLDVLLGGLEQYFANERE